MVTRLWINGISGRLGSAVSETCKQKNGDFHLLGGSTKDSGLTPQHPLISQIDLLIDTSSPYGNMQLLQNLNDLPRKPRVLICTTGLSPQILDSWKDFSKETAVMLVSNTSLGIFLCSKMAQMIAPICQNQNFDCHIMETHHKHKLDKPSGTALTLANALVHTGIPREKIDIHSMRAGGVIGEHIIRFTSDHEEITISHRAFNRNLFADGALLLAKWLMKQESDFYQLDDLNAEDFI